MDQDAQLEVVALAERPSEVENLIKKHAPDVITLDIHMPEMDGVTLLKKIFPLYRIPTVMISSISIEEGDLVLSALESGAVDYVQKPTLDKIGIHAPVICEKIKAAATANVSSGPKVSVKRLTNHQGGFQNSLIALGASTGGTEALRVVLQSLPEKIPPIVIVQHIPPVFSKAFAERLNQICPFEVKEAIHGEPVNDNTVYIAPGDWHMRIKNLGGKYQIVLAQDAHSNRHRPAVDILFDSVSKEFSGRVVAAVLTGMGKDGAKGLLSLRNSGAFTISQDEKTSVVYGMPREAKENGASMVSLPLSEVAAKIVEELSKPKLSKKSA